MPILTEEQLDCFESYLKRDPRTGCLNWTSVTNDRGHPYFSVNNRWVICTSIIYEYYKDDYKGKNDRVFRTCGNILCLEPSHLYTKYDNRIKFDQMWQLDPKTGCWLYTGLICPDGYGGFQWHEPGKPMVRMGAHRASLILYRNETFPAERPCALHKCPAMRRHCVSPKHLYAGTYSQNAYDRIRDAKLTAASGRAARMAR